MYKNGIICFLMMLMLSSCVFVSKRTVEQGNIITPDKVNQLHLGMTAAEVENVMGHAVLVNIFTPNRIDYIYTYQTGNKTRIEKKVTLIFEAGRLRQIMR